jgi:thiol-disulfide isomerase/thioredoxin
MLPELRTLEAIAEAIESAKQSRKLLLLKFGAQWCKPCKIIAPTAERIVKANSEHVVGYEVDVDVVKESLVHFNVSKLPTFILIDHGNVFKVWTGGDNLALENNVYDALEAKQNKK